MSQMAEALRQVAKDHHLGALVLALEDVQRTAGRLPGNAHGLVLKAHDVLLSVGLADRSEPWDMDPARRAVWRTGPDAEMPATPAEVENLARACVRMARDQGEYRLVQWLLGEYGDQPSFLIEVLGRVAAESVGRAHS